MPSYSVSLPLTLDSKFGFAQLTTYKGLVKQNLKMLLLTNPGEKLMDPEFGVGLKMYLFELTDGNVILNDSENIFTTNSGIPIESDIENRITTQISKYLGYIVVTRVKLAFQDNALQIAINYYIPAINSTDSFLFIDTNNIIVTLAETLENPRIPRDTAITRNKLVDMSKNKFE